MDSLQQVYGAKKIRIFVRLTNDIFFVAFEARDKLGIRWHTRMLVVLVVVVGVVQVACVKQRNGLSGTCMSRGVDAKTDATVHRETTLRQLSTAYIYESISL